MPSCLRHLGQFVTFFEVVSPSNHPQKVQNYPIHKKLKFYLFRKKFKFGYLVIWSHRLNSGRKCGNQKSPSLGPLEKYLTCEETCRDWISPTMPITYSLGLLLRMPLFLFLPPLSLLREINIRGRERPADIQTSNRSWLGLWRNLVR